MDGTGHVDYVIYHHVPVTVAGAILQLLEKGVLVMLYRHGSKKSSLSSRPGGALSTRQFESKMIER